MARRGTLAVLAEAYAMADRHITMMSGADDPGVLLPRDVLASLFVPVIESRDRMERKIRKLARQGNRIEAALAAVQASLPVPQLVELDAETWQRARQSMMCLSLPEAN